MKPHLILLAVLCCLFAACEPKPQSGLVFYEQPSPILAAAAHTKERPGLIWYTVAPTGSMEPMITGGDAVVVDTTVPFDKKSLPDGTVCNYRPTEAQRQYYPGLQAGTTIIHMLAAWSGDECIMSGIANEHYERGVLRMTKETYVGKVIAVYTKRKKP